MRRALRGLVALLRKGRAEQDLDDELRTYLADAVDATVRRGMPRRDAIRAARAAIGSLDRVLMADPYHFMALLSKAALVEQVLVLPLEAAVGQPVLDQVRARRPPVPRAAAVGPGPRLLAAA